jgi:hypothetical protein
VAHVRGTSVPGSSHHAQRGQGGDRVAPLEWVQRHEDEEGKQEAPGKGRRWRSAPSGGVTSSL